MYLTVACLLLCLVGSEGFKLFNRHFHNSGRVLRSTASDEPIYRIGHGYDIHRLAEGNKLVIAGVYIPYHLGAEAHSDGDAVYHR